LWTQGSCAFSFFGSWKAKGMTYHPFGFFPFYGITGATELGQKRLAFVYFLLLMGAARKSRRESLERFRLVVYKDCVVSVGETHQRKTIIPTQETGSVAQL
jgi:hypothetical protein